MSDRDELAAQVRALNEQVKLLVKTEKRLYAAQRTIERQLDRIDRLNRFALASNHHSERAPILSLFLGLILDVLRADQAVALLVDDEERFVVAATAQVEELPPVVAPIVERPTAAGFTEARPVVLRGGDVRRDGALGAVLDLAARHFAHGDAGDEPVPKVEIAIPFRHRDGRLTGVVVLRTLEALHFNDELPSDADVPFLALACLHLESALENVFLLQETARKAALEKELEVARTVQEALVPADDAIEVGRISLAGFFSPATSCGGDVWTWKQLGPDRVLVMIGDVTGHGMPSALITAVVLGAAELLPPEITPDGALALLNRAVYRAGKGRLLMSCFVAVIDVAAGDLSFANGGHPPPMIVQARGDTMDAGYLLARGSLLGYPTYPPATVHRARIEPGQAVVLFSDGIPECRDGTGRQLGDRRLRRAVLDAARTAHLGAEPGAAAAGRLRGELVRAIHAFAGDGVRDDDMTLVITTYD